MSTRIYPSPIYGPVRSRRLGLSLGINLMPPDGKICTFDCLYCECGFNAERRTRSPYPTREQVAEALESQLARMAGEGETPDVLTFAGNGEPTANPHFEEIIDDTVRLRDKWCPEARITVLSNATLAARDNVRRALMRVDNNILKLDTVNPEYIRLVDRPTNPEYDVRKIIDSMKWFKGHVIVQTMFMSGEGTANTADSYVLPWIEALKEIRPSAVMVYTIDRETPDKTLRKATRDDLDRIRDMVTDAGIKCTASY